MVQRYQIEHLPCHVYMREDACGAYVRYEDYVVLELKMAARELIEQSRPLLEAMDKVINKIRS